MRLFKILSVVLGALLGLSSAAHATAQIHVDLSTQQMHVESSRGSFSWPVSTARAGFATPRGSFAPTGLQRMHYSKKYHNSPMPYSIFFRGGYAIHGTGAVGALGRPASHGCVRLHPANAKRLYEIVQAEGGSISITGSAPTSTRYAAHRPHRHTQFAGLRHHHRHGSALAYAPAHRHHHHGVKSWQRNPTLSPF